MTELALRYLERFEEQLAAVADPQRATAMEAYLRHRFTFFGVPTPLRRAAARRAVAGLPALGSDDLLALADRAWDRPQRELQYCAIDVLRRHAAVLDGAALPSLRRLITNRSWWDSIDPLATRVVGPIVRADRDLGLVMDEWIDDADFWVARAAVLHQLLWRAETDATRLFAACVRRAGDQEFFIRKAIGWALREYAKTDPGAVRAFVAAHEHELSPLSRREALRNLT